MANSTLGQVMYDPGGLALPAPIDPGGMALPAPETDARAYPVPDPTMQQAPTPIAPMDQTGALGWANPAASSQPGAIANAPRIFGNVLHEHGNQRVLQPHELAAAQGYVEDFWRQFGANKGNVWGSGHPNDPYMGQIPFPAGVTPDPALMKPGVNYGDGATFNPQFTGQGSASGGLGPMPGTAGSAMGGAMGGAFGAPFGWMAGSFGGGRRGGVNGNRTLGEVTSPGGSDSSYTDPLVP